MTLHDYKRSAENQGSATSSAYNQTLLSGLGDQFEQAFKEHSSLGNPPTTKAPLPSSSDPNLPLRLAREDPKIETRSVQAVVPRAKSAPLLENGINGSSSSGPKMRFWLSSTDDRNQYQRSYGGAGKIAKKDA